MPITHLVDGRAWERVVGRLGGRADNANGGPEALGARAYDFHEEGVWSLWMSRLAVVALRRGVFKPLEFLGVPVIP